MQAYKCTQEQNIFMSYHQGTYQSLVEIILMAVPDDHTACAVGALVLSNLVEVD